MSHGRTPPPRRLQGRARRLALAKLRELRALGWSYREIGRHFADASSTEPVAEANPAAVIRSPHLLARAAAPRSAAADHRAFLHALDMVSEGLAFFDGAGMLVHTNRALTQVLRQPGVGEEVQKGILALAHALGSALRTRLQDPGKAIRGGEGELESREIQSASVKYRLRGSYLSADPFGLGGAVLIALESVALPRLTDEALRQRFGLSRQESRIARLLAEGRSNAEAAAEIGISPHTVRRHTERLFAKLEVRSRAEVGQRLYAERRQDAKNR